MNWNQALWAILVGLVTFVISNVALLFILVRLPATYFVDVVEVLPAKKRHPAVHWSLLIGKNLVGVVLVLAGAVMSLPGVPGPGLLCIVVGITLISIPGKQRLAQRMVRTPALLRTINRLRARYGQPPLVLDRSHNDRENWYPPPRTDRHATDR